MNVYEILENSRVYSEHDIDPNNLEMKINTTQDDSLFIQGYEVFNEKEYNFFQNGKNIDLTLESESHGNIEFKLLYIKDENEFFAIDLDDNDDIEDMFQQIQSYLKG